MLVDVIAVVLVEVETKSASVFCIVHSHNILPVEVMNVLPTVNNRVII